MSGVKRKLTVSQTRHVGDTLNKFSFGAYDAIGNFCTPQVKAVFTLALLDDADEDGAGVVGVFGARNSSFSVDEIRDACKAFMDALPVRYIKAPGDPDDYPSGPAGDEWNIDPLARH
jgi:hypothetical protein